MWETRKIMAKSREAATLATTSSCRTDHTCSRRVRPFGPSGSSACSQAAYPPRSIRHDELIASSSSDCPAPSSSVPRSPHPATHTVCPCLSAFISDFRYKTAAAGMDSVRERRVTDGGAVTGDSSSVAARPAEDQLRDSTTSHAGRIPQWMLMLMHDRGSLDYPERSRSRRRHARPEVSSEPAAPSEVDIISASRPGPQPAQGTVPIGAEALEQDGGSSGVAEQCPPFEAPFPTGDGPGEDPPRSAYRDSYGDFSSASSTTSSSTSFSGFDSRSVSSVTSASSATTFSAAGWNGQAGSPSASASSFGDRKRSPAGFISREHSAHGLHSLHHVRKDGAGDSGAGPGSPTDTLGDATLCLSKLSLPVTADLRAPDESDSTPLASTSLLEAPSPPRQNALAESDETAATLVPSTPTPAPHEDGTFLAPQNFATVSANLFRSSFPRKEHFPFLKNLGLKSVM